MLMVVLSIQEMTAIATEAATAMEAAGMEEATVTAMATITPAQVQIGGKIKTAAFILCDPHKIFSSKISYPDYNNNKIP